MKILFVNGHEATPTGKSKFNTYHLQITNLLTNTLFFGRHHQQLIRNYSDLQQFLYDQGSNYIDSKSLQRFQLLDYIFIDGDIHLEPYLPKMQPLVTLIKMCVKYNVKFHLNRFGFVALYYQELKNQKIVTKGQESQSKNKNQNIFKEGFFDRQIASSKNVYNSKRAQSKLYWKNTRFHYICNSKVVGNKLLKNVHFPISLYCRSKWLCYPINHLKSSFVCLVETENRSPVAIAIGNGIATLSLCEEFMTILSNWIVKVNDGMVTMKPQTQTTNIHNHSPSLFNQLLEQGCIFNQQIQQDNLLSLQSTLKRPFSSIRPTTSTTWLSRFTRPQTGLRKQTFSKINPVVRNSGPYLTEEDMRKQFDKKSEKKIITKRFLSHSKTMGEFDIKNYVQQTPSEPPKLHQFRTVDKTKWVNKKSFYVA